MFGAPGQQNEGREVRAFQAMALKVQSDRADHLGLGVMGRSHQHDSAAARRSRCAKDTLVGG